MTSSEKIARLILLLRERPHGLAELMAALGYQDESALYRALESVRRAGWTVSDQGRPKSVWIDDAASPKDREG